MPVGIQSTSFPSFLFFNHSRIRVYATTPDITFTN